MNHPTRYRCGIVVGALATFILCSTGLSGCSSKQDPPTPTVIPIASAAQSPVQTSQPTGTVYPFVGRAQAALVDASTKDLVVLADGGGTVTTVNPAALGRALQTIRPHTPVTAMTGDNSGTVYLSTRGGYLTLELHTGKTTLVSVPGHENTLFTAIARTAEGTMVLGTVDGTVCTLGYNNSTSGFSHVDSLATQGNITVVLDRAQSAVTTLTAEGRNLAHSLRAGEGATNMVADNAGRLLVADTRGGALLVFGTDPLILRQRYPVPDAPYALTYSPTLTWVSQTANNSVVGYDLSTGIPEERARYSTVRQPNSLATDGKTLYVLSGTGDGLQAIDIRGVR